MATLTYPYTLTAGQPENVNQLNSNLSAISTVLNGGVDAANVTGAVFFEQYKRLFTASANCIAAVSTAGTLCGITTATSTPPTSGSAAGGAAWGCGLFYLTASEYAVTGKTTKLLVKAAYGSNATAAGTTITIGAYPVTVAGAAGQVAFTMGTVVSGSTVALASPSASAFATGTSGDFTLPSDGAYILGFVCTGTPAANHVGLISAQLCVRNV